MLAKQVLKDQQGIPMGVFIPMQSWEKIVLQYPDIEIFDTDLKKLTKREMITRAEKSEHDIRNKKVITQSQLEKESQLW